MFLVRALFLLQLRFCLFDIWLDPGRWRDLLAVIFRVSRGCVEL